MLPRARSSIATLVVLAACLCAGPASAFAAESAKIQPILNPDGSGRMIANSQTNPDEETWSWEACSVDLDRCAPFAQGRIVETQGNPGPAVFRVTSSLGAVALSPRWYGNVSSVSAPSVAGTVRANELVVPVPGLWLGGWEGDIDLTQLAACRRPADEGCTTLTHRHYVGGCRNGAAVIDPRFTGMHLRVAARRIPAGTPELAYAVGSPYTPDIWTPGPTVAVAFVGKIGAATGPPASGCGPSPLVRGSISKRGVATVRCGLDCRATLVVRQGKRRASVSRQLAAMPGVLPKGVALPQLRLSGKQLERFVPGRVRFVLRVFGRAVDSRTLRVPLAGG